MILAATTLGAATGFTIVIAIIWAAIKIRERDE